MAIAKVRGFVGLLDETGSPVLQSTAFHTCSRYLAIDKYSHGAPTIAVEVVRTYHREVKSAIDAPRTGCEDEEITLTK
jgi:hypothetical protein